jgi:diguanylate cyclase (GGDEF)-like protein/PAS domain S-box-containing protein
MMKRWLLISACLFLTLLAPLRAEEPPLTLGVLSYRPKPLAEAQWRPLTEHLNKSLKGTRFILKVYDYDELQEAVRQQAVDIVITQPAEYVRMVHQNGLSSPLATIISLEQGKPVRAFGGVILARSNRTDLNTLKDLDGKTIATSSRLSFGAYQIQSYELMKKGVRPATLIETGLPQDLSVAALLAGTVDAAFVRTGLMEVLLREGKLDARQVKVINQQNYPGFPFALSTRLYPEWPVVAMSHVPDDLTARIVGALLLLPHGSETTQRMGIYGFTVPADYEPVRAVMRELRAPPFDTPVTVTFQDVWKEYQLAILALLVSLAGMLVMAARESILRQRLISFGNAMGEGMYVLDRHGRATYVNRATCELLGYPREALLGKEILNFIVAPQSTSNSLIGLAPGRSSSDLSQSYVGETFFINAQGHAFPVKVSNRPVLRRGKFLHSVTLFEDISERNAQSERVYKLAFYDPLTELPNRRLLLDKLHQALGKGRASQPGALLLSDLDRFKQINDTLGHKRGDALLQAVARRIMQLAGTDGTVAHPGGDEFAILMTRLDADPNVARVQAQTMAGKILDALQAPFELEGQQHKISTSIGIVMFEGSEENPEELFKQADIAMYQAKESGRNTIRFFDKAIELQLGQRARLEADLHQAIQNQEFEVFYQPQVNAAGQVLGVEALVRWRHPRRGLVYPGDFIALAEETGLILPLGQWVLEQACRQIKAWSISPVTSKLIVSVNLSAHQIFQADFVARIREALNACGANPKNLQLELTESVLAKNIDDVIDKMLKLVELGVTFSLDDFGTGFSSLNYLKRLPLHQLKIDASFVRDLMSDPNDVAITKTIIALGHSLELEVIAEGVENQDQRDVLLRQGCPLLQGYLFGRPQPAAELTELLHQTFSAPQADLVLNEALGQPRPS